jgi:hypothetical protein
VAESLALEAPGATRVVNSILLRLWGGFKDGARTLLSCVTMDDRPHFNSNERDIESAVGWDSLFGNVRSFQ